jgi:hypothetical protein
MKVRAIGMLILAGTASAALPAVAAGDSPHHGRHHGRGIVIAQAQPAAKPVAPATVTSVPAKPKVAATPVEDLPIVDSALLSVLKDLGKTTRESEQFQKLEDPIQKAAVSAALDAVDAAVANASVAANRILPANQKAKFEKAITPESWESGLLSLPNNSHASLNVVWGKKLNGLISVSVAGNCGCKGDVPANRIGEYVVVLSGKSALDSGFDIQTQSDVNFWLGKTSGFVADATTCGEGHNMADTATPVLKALVTEDLMRRKLALAKKQERLEQQAQAQAIAAAQAQFTAGEPMASPLQTAIRPLGEQQQAALPGVSPRSTAPIVLPELKPPMEVPGLPPSAQ